MAAETMPAAASAVAAGGAPSVRQRVQAGAAWLDEHQPDWADRIDLIILDVRAPEADVIGQLYGGWEDSPLYDELEQAAALGFVAPSEAAWSAGDARATFPDVAIEAECAELDAAWRDYVLSQPFPAVTRG